MNMSDVRIDTYSNSSNRVKMNATHMPTNQVVSGEGSSQYRLKIELVERLRSIVNKP